MIETNQFYIGESVQWMRENLQKNCIDLTITSPPYDDLRKYKGYIFDYKSMLQELYRITKDGGIVVWIVGDKTYKGSETLTGFKQVIYAKEIGFNIHDSMVYAKNNPIPTSGNRYGQQFEYMFILSKGKPKTFNPIMEECIKKGQNKTISTRKADGTRDSYKKNIVSNTKKKNNIWFYSIGNYCTTKDKIAFKHPAIFPEQLAKDHILSWSNKNDIVFDPMCGSGTVCKEAFLNKRQFIGIDVSEEYINDVSIPRLKEYGWENN